MIAALCGGVGGSKLALGLYRILPADSLALVVNTADDLELWGLHISPDLDTVAYTLSGLAGPQGWGVEGDRFEALAMLERYGADTWFRVGDCDLGTHVFRTILLRQGLTLTEVTAHVASRLGVQATILPMSDGRVSTRLLVEGEWIEFQEYFVHRRHAVPVEAIRYERDAGVEPTQYVSEAVAGADLIVLANSNPVLSILPILDLPGMRDLMRGRTSPAVAVSPMLGSGSISGPAGDLMRLIGRPSTSLGVASAYEGLIDGLVIDRADEEQAPEIERLGISVRCTDTLMRDEEARRRLARETVEFGRSLR